MGRDSTRKVNLNVEMSEELHTGLKEIAERERRSLRRQIQHMLEEAMARERRDELKAES